MQPRFSREQILIIVVLMEAGLLLIATVLAHFWKIDLLPLMKLDDPKLLFVGVAFGILMSLSSLGISKLAHKFRDVVPFVGSFEEFVRVTLMPLFAEVNPMDIFLIAFASGFCEEVFFRGVLQGQCGLFWASVIFGLFHYAGNKYIFYVIWAACAGAALGYAMESFHSLWVPILAHITNNFMSITMVRYRIGYKKDE
ncbi:MAG: type II CAAX endopeptidase family protein [Candidatus Melainabacteria bacterium]|nr:type II CAAX endopeptidase family protein [Candidatus Melainabacteria bacterium]